ncbi:MAG TPA: hypothetical protein VIN40_05950 [Candidatus Tyrphobacter sp.]
MVSQPPKDTPFGLEPNVAAGLAYLLGIIGGIVMLVGGGTNKAVKWAAAQSTTMWGLYIVLIFALQLAMGMLHFYFLFMLVPLLGLLWFILWIWTTISGFQGKEVRVPVVAGLTESLFKSML